MNLMNAVGGISDWHIEEFADITPKKRRIKPWMMIASAACVAAVIVGVIVTVPRSKTAVPETSFSEFASWAYMPSVYFNDRMYGYHVRHDVSDELSDRPEDNTSYSENVSYHIPECVTGDGGYSELLEGYVEVGEITTNDENSPHINGFATGSVRGLKVGEKIYQDPDDPDDLYVYTILFMDEEYRYYHFVVNETYHSLRIGGRTYIKDFSTVEMFLYELPDGYAEVGEVTTNDRKNKFVDGFGRELHIGDKIYSSPEEPDIAYVYTNRFSTPLCYVRYVAYDG